MAYYYGEDKLIEQTANDLFAELDSETVLAYDAEDFGVYSMLGRADRKETILYRDLLQALQL